MVSTNRLKRLLLLRKYYLLRLLRTNKRQWMKPINSRRKEQGAFLNLIAEMRRSDQDSFFNYFRMTPKVFDKLHELIKAKIKKSDTNYRKCITTAERLSITLRYLASGDSMTSLAYSHRVGLATVSKIIDETCEAIWTCLQPIYLPQQTTDSWQRIAEGYKEKTNFPNCVGALDGKHISIQAPENSGSLFFNYKGSHSIILMAACDSNYQYTFVNIGAYGKNNDSSVFSNTSFGQDLLNGTLNVPPKKIISQGGKPMPFVFVADEAFPLKVNLMRPYPGRGLTDARRGFNYRLCRARRMIENTFGITANRWRILRKPIIASVNKVEKMVKAIVCLHNYVTQTEINSSVCQRFYMPPYLIDREVEDVIIPGRWRSEASGNSWQDLGRISANSYTEDAKTVRDMFTEYFNDFPLPWQSRVISRG